MPRLTAPPRALPLVLIAGVLPALAFGLVACDSGGSMNEPPKATVVTSVSEPVVGDTVALDASKSDDPDGDELSFSWTLQTPSGSNASLSAKTTADPSFVPDTTGNFTAEVVVSDGDGSDTDEASVNALKELPETITVTFENVAADGDSLITGTVTWEDSVVAEDIRSAEVTIPASRDEGRLCFQESDLFNQACLALTPTSNISETQEILADRKTVKLTVIPDPPYGDPGQTDVTVYEPFDADSTEFTGENTVDLAKRKGGLTREVTSGLITNDPEDESKLDRLTADTTVTANGDVDLTVEPKKLLACSDEIDSDGDGSVDTEDRGCSNDAGTGYDPTDDNETSYLFRRSVARYFNDSTFVSGAENQRTAEIDPDYFPESITVAIGEVRLWIENKRLADTSKQDFRMKVLSGESSGDYTSSQISEVVADPDTTTGWKLNRVYGLTRFDGGRVYKLVAKKAEPFGNSENIEIFFAEKQNSRAHAWEYFFEKDHPDLQDGSSSAKTAGISKSKFATLENGECIDVSEADTVCKNAAQRTQHIPR